MNELKIGLVNWVKGEFVQQISYCGGMVIYIYLNDIREWNKKKIIIVFYF